MMSPQQFDNQLRALVRAKPFQPFVIVLDDGRTLFVEKPAVAFDGGGGTTATADGEIHFFECEHVLEFRLASEEAAR